MNYLHEELVKFGLGDKEAKIYLSLLESGHSSVSDIAKKSKLNRSTTYVILDSLLEKGLVGIVEDAKIKYYSAVTPDRIVQFLENKSKKYNEFVGIARNILPELKALHKGVGLKPRVKFFDGVEGIKSAYEETLNSTETISAFASIENMHQALSDYFPAYYHRRAAKNIKINAIFPDTPEAQERVKNNTQELRETACIPHKEYQLSPEIMIYDNKVVFLSLIEKFAFIVESQEIADAMKVIFKLSWSEAQKLDKKK